MHCLMQAAFLHCSCLWQAFLLQVTLQSDGSSCCPSWKIYWGVVSACMQAQLFMRCPSSALCLPK